MYSFQIENMLKEKPVKKYTYNLWSLGRCEKLEGIGPLRLLFDRSLPKYKKTRKREREEKKSAMFMKNRL